MLLTRITKTVFILISFGFFFNSCSDGRDGRDGRDGIGSNVNVLSETYYVAASEWVPSQFGGIVDRFNPAISLDVLDYGLVQVYYSEDINPNTRRWIALPLGDLGYSYVVNSVTFETYGISGSAFDLWFKVVVIPASFKMDGVDMNDFEAVQAVYGLED